MLPCKILLKFSNQEKSTFIPDILHLLCKYQSCKNTTWSNSRSQLSHIQFFSGPWFIYLVFTQVYYKVSTWQVLKNIPFASCKIPTNALKCPQLLNIQIQWALEAKPAMVLIYTCYLDLLSTNKNHFIRKKEHLGHVNNKQFTIVNMN